MNDQVSLIANRYAQFAAKHQQAREQFQRPLTLAQKILVGHMKHIADDSGGVGDINAFVYDIEGNACAHEYADRVLGLTLAELKSIPFRIGVAATAAKALPLYGALRGGYLHALITDETAACGILNLFEQGFRKAP